MRTSGERLIGIDVLRGVAILWVVLFHLWGDIEFFPGAPYLYYDAFADRVRGGVPAWETFTAFTDLIFRLGFEGVPLFMMISGMSLTIAAARSGDALRWPRFFAQRFRKLLVPYWAGVALTYGVMALIAWRQVALGGGGFGDHFSRGVTIAVNSRVEVDGGVVFASVALIPRLVQDEWFFAPQLALWFVGLLVQYYLLFPLLFIAMRRAGLVLFLAATFAVTVAANAWAVHEYGALELKFWLVTGWAPFRLFEFTAGMAIGWLLVSPAHERALGVVRHPFAIAGVVAAGFAAHSAGDLLIGRWTAEQIIARSNGLYWQALALPLSTLGLGLLALPLVAKRPSRVDVSVPVRLLGAVGVISYAVLIVNDAMRLIASQIRFEGAPDPVWGTFLVAVYIPASVALAWPLARVLGLVPARPRRPTGTLRQPEGHELSAAPARL